MMKKKQYTEPITEVVAGSHEEVMYGNVYSQIVVNPEDADAKEAVFSEDEEEEEPLESMWDNVPKLKTWDSWF